MCRAVARSREVILGTTFYYVGRRFGRSPTGVAKFLWDSISSVLRYCPSCIAQRSYYKLTWRFLMLTGCSIHNCKLLDTCMHCGEPVPYFTKPLHIGVCPNCRRRLGKCHAGRLDDEEKQQVRETTRELEFLLSRVESSADPGEIGQRFQIARQMQGWTRNGAALKAQLATYNVKGIETGKIHQQGASFQCYAQYAACLGVPLRVFLEAGEWDSYVAEHEGSRQEPAAEAGSLPAIALNEEVLLTAVEQAIAQLERDNQPVTRQGVYSLVGHYPGHLLGFPRVRKQLHSLPYKRKSKSIRSARTEEREAMLVEKVTVGIAKLEESGTLPTRRAVSLEVGYSIGALYYYPAIRTLLDELVPTSADGLKARVVAREDALIAKIAAVAGELDRQEQPVTAKAICSTSGLSRTSLDRYPRVMATVRELVDMYSVRRKVKREAREQELLNRVIAAKKQLEAEGWPVTCYAIGKLVGVTTPGLSKYPSIRQLFTALVQENSRD